MDTNSLKRADFRVGANQAVIYLCSRVLDFLCNTDIGQYNGTPRSHAQDFTCDRIRDTWKLIDGGWKRHKNTWTALDCANHNLALLRSFLGSEWGRQGHRPMLRASIDLSAVDLVRGNREDNMSRLRAVSRIAFRGLSTPSRSAYWLRCCGLARMSIHTPVHKREYDAWERKYMPLGSIDKK